MGKGNKVAVIRREHFNAAHRLLNASWTVEKNQAVFGKCYNPNFHGHNYDLEVKVVGEIDPQTGYVIDMKVLSDLIQDKIVDKFDHKNLNLDVPEFLHLNPTAENICVVIYDLLRPFIPSDKDLHVKLFETERNIVEYPY